MGHPPVRAAEIAALGSDADAGHIIRLGLEEATLARYDECERERSQKEAPVAVPEWESLFDRLSDKEKKMVAVGAVVALVLVIIFAPEAAPLALAF